MKESTVKRMVREHTDNTKGLWLLIFGAAVLTVLIFAVVHKTVNAQTYTRRVFACPYAWEGAEPVAHHHNADCYEDGVLICTLPERDIHIHSDECYREEKILICGLEENDGHIHTDACYIDEPVLICPLEESAGHVHSIENGCYTLERGELICTNEDPEHEHTDDCYAWDYVLTCGIPEGEGAHYHSDECYQIQRVLSCGMAEGEGAHRHTDECYEIQKVLICGQEELTEEHVHTADCFQVVDMSPDEIEDMRMGELPESDPTADVESRDEWESRFSSVVLSGEWDKDLLTIAETQLGYTESQHNFEVVLNETDDSHTLKGWTHYGAWYGMPYGDWSAMFVSFCLNYAGIPETAVPYDCDPASWAAALSDRGMYADASAYYPKAGDIVFFDRAGDGLADHVGIVYRVDADSSSMTAIEGDRTTSVASFEYSLSDPDIRGYGILPENPKNSGNAENPEPAEDEPKAESSVLTFEDEVEGMHVVVEADADAFPAGTTMVVAPVYEQQILDKISDSVDGDVLEVMAVDITFLDAEGVEIEPAKPIRVSITQTNTPGLTDPTVVHVENNGDVSVVEPVEDAADGEADVSFEADSFSVYGVVYKKIEKQIKASDNETYHITLTYDQHAGIPDNAELDVREILEGSEEYAAYLASLTETVLPEQTAEAGENEGESGEAATETTEAGEGQGEAGEVPQSSEIVFARFFDISILVGGVKYEPHSAVQVEIAFVKDNEVDGNGDVGLAHFSEEGEAPVLLDATATVNENSLESISFEAESFSVYSVYQILEYGKTDNLSGNYFIMRWNAANDYGFLLTAKPNSNNVLATKVWLRYNRLVYAGNQVDLPTWTFTPVTAEDNGGNQENLYYVQTSDSKYLNLSGANPSLTGTPTTLLVSTDGTGTIVLSNADNTKRLKFNTKYEKVNPNTFVTTNSSSSNDDSVYMTLIRAETVNIDSPEIQHTADKVSVSDLVDGDKVVLYRSVWNNMLNRYDLLAVDGEGELVQVTDEGGTIGWYSAETTDSEGNKIDLSSLEWTFTVGRNNDEEGTDSGYYWLYNESTGKYLTPRTLYNGSSAEEMILTGDAVAAGEDLNYSVQLPGRRDGAFDSVVVAESDDGIKGLKYVKDDHTWAGLKLMMDNSADQFNFAHIVEKEELTEVETLDNESFGIYFQMFDYPSRKWMSAQIGSDEIAIINDDRNNRNHYVPGLVQRTLGADGLPVGTIPGSNVPSLFSSTYRVGSANHLLLASAYSETGYFEYNSAQNYAYYNNGSFTVYNQLGAPRHRNDHGNFMPFSKLLPDIFPPKADKPDYGRNTKDAQGNILPADDPRYNEPIHQIQTEYVSAPGYQDPSTFNDYDYNFGMTMEAGFVLPSDKKDRYGNDIIFDFSGDDDLWLFVDNVLVLDLGGIHSAISGTVNFTTGEIVYRDLNPQHIPSGWTIQPTIKACFQDAGVFPDGTEWDQARIDDYFDGNTLKGDYSGHTLKMFYMERGKSASNLHMRFNLSAVQNDSFLVAKEITGTDKQKYQDEKFYFQAFTVNGETITPLTSADAKMAMKTDSGVWQVSDSEETASHFIGPITINGEVYNNVFMLGHNEGVYFTASSNTEYYVREIGVDSNRIKVYANGVWLNQDTDRAGSYSVEKDVVAHRKQVIFSNDMTPQELVITKELVNAEHLNPDHDLNFKLKLKLGPRDGQYEPYSVGPYYIVKRDGNTITYYTQVNGKLLPLVEREGEYYYTAEGQESVKVGDPSFTSGQDGSIFVPAGYSVIVKNLLPGMVFQVEEPETDIPHGYSLVSIEDENKSAHSFELLSESESTTLKGKIKNETAYVLVKNKYAEGMIRLLKVSAKVPGEDTGTKYLSGAEFELYDAEPKYGNGMFSFDKKPVTSLKSNENGYLEAQPIDTENHYYYGADKEHLMNLKLAAGTYYLLETKAPDGYNLANGIYAFELPESGKLKILGIVKWDDDNENIKFEATNNMTEKPDSDGTVVGEIMISNVPGYVLPKTGGSGTALFTALGGLMMVTAGAVLTLRKKKNKA